MKKLLSLLIIALALLSMMFIITSCSCNGDKPNDTDTDVDSDQGDEEVFGPVRGISKTEIIDGNLWVTYTDTPDAPVDLGKMSSIGESDESSGLIFYPLGNDTYGVSCGTLQNAKSIEIPKLFKAKLVYAILPNAFKDCTNLESISVPSGVAVVDSSAFTGCPIKNATIPYAALSLMPSSLEALALVSGSTIDDKALASFASLKSIEIPHSVLSIHPKAFNNCPALTAINMDESNPHYESKDGNLYNQDMTAIIKYAQGKSAAEFEIASDIIYISSYAFYGCNTITSIEIPSTVSVVESYAFTDCSSLTSVKIASSSTKLSENAFSNCPVKEADVPAKHIMSMPKDNVETITINDNATVELFALSSFPSLTSILVSDSNEHYQSIDGNLYSKDGKTLVQYAIGKTATSFEIPNGITAIGHCAFYGCTSLETVIISEAVTSISSGAFGECTKLSSLTIPSSVTTIYSGAFYGCTALTSIVIPATVTSISNAAFEACSNIKFYCEAESQPSGWEAEWNISSYPVEWGYNG